MKTIYYLLLCSLLFNVSCHQEEKIEQLIFLDRQTLQVVLQSSEDYVSLPEYQIEFHKELNNVYLSLNDDTKNQLKNMFQRYPDIATFEAFAFSEEKQLFGYFKNVIETSEFSKARMRIMVNLRTKYVFEVKDLMEIMSQERSYANAKALMPCNEVFTRVYNMIFEEVALETYDIVQADRSAWTAASYAYIGCTMAMQ